LQISQDRFEAKGICLPRSLRIFLCEVLWNSLFKSFNENLYTSVVCLRVEDDDIMCPLAALNQVPIGVFSNMIPKKYGSSDFLIKNLIVFQSIELSEF